jgi:putative membrane protein insertion efficiency factor
MAKIFYFIIRIYQKAISPFIGPRCRYLPTCSDYALEALEVHGIRLGGYFTVLRLLRCNPWGSSGYDPVPPENNKSDK